MLFHVILIFDISATSQSSTGHTAIYTGVGSFVVTALMSVIIVMATLRYDVIIFIIYFTHLLSSNISKQYHNFIEYPLYYFLSSNLIMSE